MDRDLTFKRASMRNKLLNRPQYAFRLSQPNSAWRMKTTDHCRLLPPAAQNAAGRPPDPTLCVSLRWLSERRSHQPRRHY